MELLERLPYDTLKKLEKDDEFIQRLQKVYGDFRAYMAEKPKEGMPTITYFSMEYGIHNSLKTFSGGLGLLAGDYLKEASDYNVPLIGDRAAVQVWVFQAGDLCRRGTGGAE